MKQRAIFGNHSSSVRYTCLDFAPGQVWPGSRLRQLRVEVIEDAVGVRSMLGGHALGAGHQLEQESNPACRFAGLIAEEEPKRVGLQSFFNQVPS